MRPTVAIALLVLMPVILAVSLRAVSRRVVFPKTPCEALAPMPDVSEWSLEAPDGVAVRALEIAGPEGARVFVYFHNNRETMAQGVGLGRELRKNGLGVVLPEYRGYGVSAAAQPSEDGLYADAETVLLALHARGIGPARIVLCGLSLGTGVAAEMARRGHGAALVLIAPYTSLPDVVTDRVPGVPARLLMPDWFDTLDKSREIRVPTLVVHGDSDDVIPFWMGNKLAESIPRARLLRVAGGHHGDLFARSHGDLVQELVHFAKG